MRWPSAWLALPYLLLVSAQVTEVFLVPHSHCDVGWLTTVQHYYDERVQFTLSTVVETLMDNPSYRFIWSETKWFELWWPNQTPLVQSKFTQLVTEGRLEFVGGGWSQSDEVTPSYRDIVDNTCTGHEYIRRTLGAACPNSRCVRFGWQIDMFAGYSAAIPSLWRMMGYDGMVIRFEGPDDMRQEWAEEKAFEFVWEGSPNLSADRQRILTHVIQNNYGDMMGDFDFSNDKNAIVNTTVLKAKANAFVEFVKSNTPVYQGPVMAVWGSDFAFSNAQVMFGNMSMVIDELNANPDEYGVNVQYATLSNYFDHLHSLNLTFPLKQVDFSYGWPHSWTMGFTHNKSIQYQTGATSSRAHHKRHVREVSDFHRSTEVAFALGVASKKVQLGKKNLKDLQKAWDALGVVQHHDSLPGTMSTEGTYTEWSSRWDYNVTEKDRCNKKHCRVLEDYTERLVEAMANLTTVMSSSLQAISNSTHPVTLSQTGSQSTVLIFNSLANPRQEVVKVDLPSSFLELVESMLKGGKTHSAQLPSVTDSYHKPIPAQIDTSGTGIWFLASVAALGHTTYYLLPNDPSGATSVPSYVPFAQTLSNGVITARFDNKTGLLAQILQAGGVNVSVSQQYYEYINGTGGPYCLIEQDIARVVPPPGSASTLIGKIMSEVYQDFSGKDAFDGGQGASFLVQRTRVFQQGLLDIVEVEHRVGELAAQRELISRLATNLDTQGFLYNDVTGMELHERIYNRSLPISANYHSMVQTGVVKDRQGPRQLSVLTRQTMGIASLAPGELEYMLIRNINWTDDQGPWPHSERDPINTTVRLTLAQDFFRNMHAFAFESPLLPLYTTGTPGVGISAPVTALPFGAHLLSLFVRQPLDEAEKLNPEFVLRLQNLVEHGPALSVVLADFLNPTFQPNTCTEKTLSLQQDRAVSVPLVWNFAPSERTISEEAPSPRLSCADPVTLGPIDIRTFLLL